MRDTAQCLIGLSYLLLLSVRWSVVVMWALPVSFSSLVSSEVPGTCCVMCSARGGLYGDADLLLRKTQEGAKDGPGRETGVC